MTTDEFSKAMGNIRDEYLQEAEQPYIPKRKPTIWFAAAAILTILISGYWMIQIFEENLQYQKAITYLTQNGISTEQLSKQDTVTIYEDIIHNRFSCDETIQLLLNSPIYQDALAHFVEYDMSTENLTPGDVLCVYLDITNSNYEYSKTAQVIAESIHYKDAIQFFEANELPSEDFTRSEIIRIYQDITTESFDYDETAKLILESVTKRVDGFEIKGDFFSKEELKSLWHMYGSWPSAGDKNVEAKAGITYEIDNQYPQEGISEYRRGIIRKYLDGQLLWELEIPEFAIDYNYWKVENEYICIYSPLWSDDYYKFALIDPNGNILFTHNFIETTQEEWIHGVTIAENSLVLITYTKDPQSLGFYEFDFNGNQLKYRKNQLPGMAGFNRVIRVSDGYLVWIGIHKGTSKTNSLMVAKLDFNGQLVTTMEYASDDFDYYLENMIEYEGKLYLSVTQTPVGQSLFTGDNSIYLQIWELSRQPDSNSLAPTALIKEYYDATLLVCDAKTLELETFYTVEASRGKRLLINSDGQLEWYVEKISLVYLAPIYLSAYRLLGAMDLHLYKFDQTSNMIGYADTGTDIRYTE